MSKNPLFFSTFETSAPLILESGQTLSPVTIAYETYGELNADKTNAILICHAFSGDAHVSEGGWWDAMVGPGKPLDTDRYFVVCSNVLGGCKGTTGPASVNPETGQPYALSFPVVTIGDMVTVQKALIDHLGITRLKLVIGGSMGGMQALEWAIKYPNSVAACVPIASTPRLSPQALAFDAVGRSAITADPKWDNGTYYGQSSPVHGLAIARMIGHITYLSDESMSLKFGRKLQQKNDYGYDMTTDFEVESYLKYQGDKFVGKFDPNSYLYLTKAISYFDLEKKYGSLEAAFSRCLAKFLVVSISSDWLYTPKQSKDVVKVLMKLGKAVTYADVQSPFGHDAFLIDNPQLFELVRSYLEQVA
ncbi:MAG: homoserine O-acetyltransferase [Candidatus Margulisiibacteriota bacterium]